MAFYGIGGGTIGTTSMVRGTWSTAHVHSTSDWSDIGQNDLAPGMYAIFFNFTPSPNSGDINNNDPDAYQIRVLYDGNRFGLGLHSSEDPLLFRQDLQNLSNGGSYSYCGGLWRAQESSWGATNQKNIAFQIAQANNGYVGFISEFMPATFTITEVME